MRNYFSRISNDMIFCGNFMTRNRVDGIPFDIWKLLKLHAKAILRFLEKERTSCERFERCNFCRFRVNATRKHWF